jgi:superfamily II DNA or RNA helicase
MGIIQNSIPLDLVKDKIQNEAVDAWIGKKFKGTLELATGSGKTFCFFKVLMKFPKIKKVLFLAETTERETDLYNDLKKFNEIFNVDLLKERELTFMCYQSAYKLKDTKWDLVCADEIHDSLTPTYSKFYSNNFYHGLLGLSAKVKRNVIYEKQGFSKGDLLDVIAPVVYRYTLSQSVDLNTSKQLNIFIINHQLDTETKNYLGGTVKRQYYTTERKEYDYWHKQFIKYCYEEVDETEDIEVFKREKDFKIKQALRKRSEVLFKVKSKEVIIKKLITKLKDKTLIFGNSLEALLSITPNVVSSKNKDQENKRIRDEFSKGDLNCIASFKKLKQGANLGYFQNTIIHSYYSTDIDFIQRLGRQRNSEEEGFVFIIKTNNTVEEKWLLKIREVIQSYNVIECENVDKAISIYEEMIK